MYSRTSTINSTNGFSQQIDRLLGELDTAEAVVVGAGAGLSAAAGFTYGGERFREHFADFEARYGFHDMYTGGFHPYDTPEEYWAYWSRNILVNRYMDAPLPVYRRLLALLEGKNYFVLTTNVDHCFQKAGFDKARLFYTQGDYGLFQCSGPCCQETFDNEGTVRAMAARQQNLRIPSDLVPRCPRCGRPLTMNLRVDDAFVQDEGWYAAARRYQDFVRRHRGCAILYLELGVGMNTPGIIKFNFWRQVHQNRKAKYVCINRGQSYAPHEIEKQSLCIDADIGAILSEL
jgi:NAD-dependent SIR2 family protein deacetylase